MISPIPVNSRVSQDLFSPRALPGATRPLATNTFPEPRRSRQPAQPPRPCLLLPAPSPSDPRSTTRPLRPQAPKTTTTPSAAQPPFQCPHSFSDLSDSIPSPLPALLCLCQKTAKPPCRLPPCSIPPTAENCPAPARLATRQYSAHGGILPSSAKLSHYPKLTLYFPNDIASMPH